MQGELKVYTIGLSGLTDKIDVIARLALLATSLRKGSIIHVSARILSEDSVTHTSYTMVEMDPANAGPPSIRSLVTVNTFEEATDWLMKEITKSQFHTEDDLMKAMQMALEVGYTKEAESPPQSSSGEGSASVPQRAL